MTLQKMFLDLVKEAFDENIRGGMDSLNARIETLRQRTFEKAEGDFQSLNGSQLDPYVAGVRGADYLSSALREQENIPEKPFDAIEGRLQLHMIILDELYLGYSQNMVMSAQNS